MSQRPSYSEGIGFGALSFGAIGVVGVVTSVVTARLYGVEVIGEFALAYAPTATVWYVSTVKEQAALVRELSSLSPRAPRVTGLFLAVFSFSAALTFVVSALAVPFVYLVFRGPIDRPDLFLPACANLAIFAFLTNTGWNLDTVLSAFLAGSRLFAIRLHQAVTILAWSAILGIVSPTVWGLVLATALSSVSPLMHRAASVRAYMRVRVDRQEVRDGFRALPGLLRFGVKVAPGTIAQGISNEIGTWVLGAVASIAAVGGYNRALTVGRRLLDLNFRITEMLLPALVRRRAEGDGAGFDRVLVQTMRYSSICLLLPAAAAGGASQAVMDVFGPGFAQASDALALLLLMPALMTLSTVQAHALYAVDRPLATTVISFARLAVTVAVTVPLAVGLGATGAALGVLAGYAADLAWKLVTVRRHLSRPWLELWPLRRILALGLAYAAGFAVARAIQVMLPFPVNLLPAVLLGSLAFGIALAAAGGVTGEDWRRLRSVGTLMLARLRPAARDHASARHSSRTRRNSRAER